MIHYCAAMAGMDAGDVAEVLAELVEEVRRRGELPPIDRGSFETNRIWARRFRFFPRLLRADIERTNDAGRLWSAERLTDDIIVLPDD